MARIERLVFNLSNKDILNSNSMPSHFIAKGKMVAKLRELAAQAMLDLHPEESKELVEKRLHQLKLENDEIIRKKRAKKRLAEKGLNKEDFAKELDGLFPSEPLVKDEITPLFRHFKMTVFVFPPTRRRMDPPNLWPTVKALTDGATDAVGWLDDDFSHLLETSFRYGGLSGEAGNWRIELLIEEIEDLSAYQIEAEVAP